MRFSMHVVNFVGPLGCLPFGRWGVGTVVLVAPFKRATVR